MVSPRFHCDLTHLKLAIDDRLHGDAQQELAAHLESCRDCRVQLESLAAGRDWWDKAKSHLAPETETETSAFATPGGQAPVDQPWLGFLTPLDDQRFLGLLGPYHVTDVIGSGGFGVVLKAFDPALNRYVAIKVLAPNLAASGAARRRFAREAQAAAAVVHEHVVAIHQVAENGGLPYLVMPYVAGESLDERITRHGPLGLKEILRIAAQTSAGLAAAHAQGLVHRDIKPANILLENGVERVKITDFGLARTIDDASQTQSGVVAGTPQYMAPEQARGEPVDHRSDLFSLGSLIYAMCTGHSPFRAETFMGVWRRLCEDEPRPVHEVNAEIPDWFSEIVAKLHAKQPAERFQSAEEVSELLGRHLAHLQQPAIFPRPARLKQPARAKHRLSAKLVCSLAAAMVVASGLGLVAWQWPPARREADATKARSQQDGGRAETATAPGEGAGARLAEWNSFDAELRQTMSDAERLERELSRPASSVSTDEAGQLSAINAELEAIERQLEMAE
jgi:hypothetical protein